MARIIYGDFWDRLALPFDGADHDLSGYPLVLIRDHATDDQRTAIRQELRTIDRGGQATRTKAGVITEALSDRLPHDEMTAVVAELAHTPVALEDEVTDAGAATERERSWWFGVDDIVTDEQRQAEADLAGAQADGRVTPLEDRRVRQDVDRTRAALKVDIAIREEWTGYAIQVMNIAAGLVITAVTAGAAGPIVLSTLVEAAVANAVARVAIEKTFRKGFEIDSDAGRRAFFEGAVDGVAGVLTAGMGGSALEGVGMQGAKKALENGSADLALKLVSSAVDGGTSGGISGIVGAVAHSETWQDGVLHGLATTVKAGIDSAKSGAQMGAAMTGVHHVGGKVVKTLGGKNTTKPPTTAEPQDPLVTVRPDPTTPRGSASVESPHAAKGQTGLYQGDPRIAMVGESPVAAREVLAKLGRWEVAMDHLKEGTGPAAALDAATRTHLITELVAHRRALQDALHERFQAEPLGKSSTEPGSDLDLNLDGPNAGERMLEARALLDAEFPGWRETYRMELLVDAGRLTGLDGAASHLEPAERAAVHADMTRFGETLTIAKQARNSSPADREALLGSIGDAAVADRVRALSELSPSQLAQAEDLHLRTADDLARRLAAETDTAARLATARELARETALANFCGENAYLTPGGVSGYATQGGLRGPHEVYQAALDQIGMISHEAFGHGGVLAAMRHYEALKYISRLCDVLERAGVSDPRLAFLRNWSELAYAVDRNATGATDRVVEPGDLTSKATSNSRVRYDDLGSTPGVSDAFLLQNYDMLRAMLHDHLPELRSSALPGETGGPTIELPAPTEAERNHTTAPHPAASDINASVGTSDAPAAVEPQHLTGLGDPDVLERIADRATAAKPVREGASTEEHQRAIADAVLHEAKALGIPRPKLVIQPLGDPRVNGFYEPLTNTLTLSTTPTTNGAPRFDPTTPEGSSKSSTPSPTSCVTSSSPCWPRASSPAANPT